MIATYMNTPRIWPDLLAVHRHNPRKADQYWRGNPYWAKLKLRDARTIKH
ncbi:MAG: hypothetical protein JKX71_04230 [Amylibacter sp.]|nr:hypothetical protein [Amylibacter sp.]